MFREIFTFLWNFYLFVYFFLILNFFLEFLFIYFLTFLFSCLFFLKFINLLDIFLVLFLDFFLEIFLEISVWNVEFAGENFPAIWMFSQKWKFYFKLESWNLQIFLNLDIFCWNLNLNFDNFLESFPKNVLISIFAV